MIARGDFADRKRFQSILKDAIVIETTPARIATLSQDATDINLAKAVDSYVRAIRAAQKALGRNIILFVDEMHTFQSAQLEALKRSLDSRDGIYFIGATTHNEYNLLIKNNKALRRRLQPVDVREFSEEETKALLKETVVPELEHEFRNRAGAAKITDEAIDAAIHRAREYVPESARPEGPFKLLQDVVIRSLRLTNDKTKIKVTANDVGKFVTERLHLPLDPTDPAELDKQIDRLKTEMRETVVDQHRVTDAMVDLWHEISLGLDAKKTHRVMLIAGPTGAGKTFAGKTFAKLALGTEERLLEIDATKYKEKYDLSTLLGAAPGLVTSDERRGVLPEFLDGKGKGTNIILINEIDKASPAFAEAIMELLDTGRIDAADGRRSFLGKSLVVFTSNKGDDKIYPRGQGTALSRAELEKRLDGLTDASIKNLFLEPDPNHLNDHDKDLHASILERIDRAVAAAPPSKEGAIKVARQSADEMEEAILRRYHYRLHLDDSVLEHIVDSVYIPENGVRSVVRSVTSAMLRAHKALGKDFKPKADQYMRSPRLPENPDSYQLIKVGDRKAKPSLVAATVPAKREIDPIADPAERHKLSNLAENLSKHVFGQPEAVDTAARAIRARALNPQVEQPGSMLFLGPTGTGKTELARSIALERFGDRGRLKSFNMAEIKREADMWNIFGSARGHVGADSMAPFEKFLNDFPEGGVIVFDEIGDMGGATPEGAKVKESLLAMFKSMLDKGKWTSSQGKEYDLRKYFLMFTSNEGQELFGSAPTDDIRLAIWQKAKTKENLERVLRQHGWSEALIGRLKNRMVLAKPLMHEERVQIAKKLFEQAIDPMKKAHKIKDVVLADDFFERLSDAFFSHTQGARTIEGFVEDAITDLIGKPVFDTDNPKALDGATLTFNLEDNFAGKETYDGTESPQRHVTLSMKINSPTFQKEYQEEEVTSQAPEKKLVSRLTSLKNALHEAGHAVVNDPKRTGDYAELITVRATGNKGGYVQFISTGTKSALSREDVVARIGRLLAAREAEKAEGFEPDAGWEQDIVEARREAERAVSTLGLSANALTLPSRDGEVLNGRAAQREVRRLLQDGEEYARKQVEENLPAIHTLALALYEKQQLAGEELKTLLPKRSKPEDDEKGSSPANCSQQFRKILQSLRTGS